MMVMVMVLMMFSTGENVALDSYIARVKSIPATVVLQKSTVRYHCGHAGPNCNILP